MTHPSLPPPDARMQDVLFRSLAQMVLNDIAIAIARNSAYRETSAHQFAVKAAHHARDWYLEVRGDDEPLPEWMSAV